MPSFVVAVVVTLLLPLLLLHGSYTISKGTLVSVEPKTRRGRPNSEGGFGTVTKKKRRKQDVSIAAPDTAATETSGISLYDVRYTLDGRLSTEVERSRVNIAMLGTTARRRIGEDSVALVHLLLYRYCHLCKRLPTTYGLYILYV